MIVYDIETYPNVFLVCFIHVETQTRLTFEISQRRNDLIELLRFLKHCQNVNEWMVGYNNLNFDYPVVHNIMVLGDMTTIDIIYEKAMGIIFGDSFKHHVWPNQRFIKQLDLFKINHFDNKAKSTSLKALEFNMRSINIQDLPYPPGTYLEAHQIPLLAEYCMWDTSETEKFLHICRDAIKLRYDLTVKYDWDFMNHNDTKIGKDFFTMKLEQSSPCCTGTMLRPKKIRQTIRGVMHLRDVIFPYIQFREPEFQRIHAWFLEQSITETKAIFDDVSCVVGNLKFVFGTGGIHGSIDSTIVYSDSEYVIVDLDVTSYYPSLAIKNHQRPAHLGDEFCDVYEELFEMRKGFEKGTAENLMIKLALNGVYGDSNNEYSCFYDPQYTMAITVNGQLLLCMLAEWLLIIPHLQLIQANTDGVTVRLPRARMDQLRSIWASWEEYTCLQLESVEYNRMFIRDVNNYIAEDIEGKLKRKGAYEYEMGWHQNQSALVVQKAVEANLVNDVPVEEFILNHADVMDFMLRVKVPRSSKLKWGWDIVQNVSRYYISTNGRTLTKIMPGIKIGNGFYLKKGYDVSVYEQFVKWSEYMNEHQGGYTIAFDERIHTKDVNESMPRRIGVNVGWLVTVCNDLTTHTPANINYSWYIDQALKLIEPLRGL